MTPSRKISRRSFLGRVGGGSLMAGSFLALTGCVGYGYSDSDPFDPAGAGRGYRGGWGRPRGGCTDGDRGEYADPAGGGRNCRGGGSSDQDSGQYADPPGQGRGGDGRGGSDSDSGPNGDPAGQGRRGGGNQGYSD